MHNEFLVEHRILEDAAYKKLPASVKDLYIVFCKHKNRYGDKMDVNGKEDKWFFRTENNLAADTGRHKQTVKKGKKVLLANHLIEMSRGRYWSINCRASNWYRVVSYDEWIISLGSKKDGDEKTYSETQKKHTENIRKNIPIIKKDTKNDN